MSATVRAVWALLWKELATVRRSRHVVAAELAFALGAVAILVFAFPNVKLSAELQSGLMWVVLYFAAMMTVARSYVLEQEAGTLLYLMLTVPIDAVYWGKLVSGMLWLVVVGMVQCGAMMLLELLPAKLAVVGVVAVASVAIAGATTLLSALVAVAQLRGWVFAVIAFPIVMPILLMGVDALANVLAGASLAAVAPLVGVMLLYLSCVSIVGWWLFPLIWSEA